MSLLGIEKKIIAKICSETGENVTSRVLKMKNTGGFPPNKMHLLSI